MFLRFGSSFVNLLLVFFKQTHYFSSFRFINILYPTEYKILQSVFSTF